ncbi:hypothetical protein EBT31_08715 [bacterium]|jgi:hypothetical protein|nr:hypothetical protein [bacterium]
MKPSQVAQAACDKLSFTDSATLALAKKFCVRRYSMIWDSCLWNDTLGVISIPVVDGEELITLSTFVTSGYASGTGYDTFLDFPVAIRFTITGDTDGIEVPAAEWVSFFQLDPNTWNNVDSRKSTPGNFVNWARLIGTPYGQAGVPRLKLVPTPNQNGTLFILGKKQSQMRQYGEATTISNDTDFELRGIENALMAYTEGDLLEYSRQYGKAQAKFQEGAAQVGIMKDMERGQQQQISRIIPDSLYDYTFQDIL